MYNLVRMYPLERVVFAVIIVACLSEGSREGGAATCIGNNLLCKQGKPTYVACARSFTHNILVHCISRKSTPTPLALTIAIEAGEAAGVSLFIFTNVLTCPRIK